MLFSMLLDLIAFSIGNAVKRNKSMKEMMSARNFVFVIMTEDGQIGRRYIFKDGKYSSDKVLSDYNIALVWKDAKVAFQTLVFGGQSGLQEAMNDWKLKILGNTDLFNFFGVVLMTALGKMKR